MKIAWKFLGTVMVLYLVVFALWSPDSQVEAMSGQTTPSMEEPVFDVSEPVVPDLSIAARDLPPIEQPPRLDREINPLRNPHHLSPDLGRKGTDTKSIDPLLESSRLGTGQTPDPILSFDGLGSDGFTPPDTVGDVGPNHYVQMVNVSFQIYDKSGNVVLADTPFNALFTGAGGECQAQNDGDPIVVYDDMADRWLLSQFADIFGTMTMCLAVSQTPDPTGAYYLYEFNGLPDVPDYFKFGAWPDGYYMSTNSGSPNAYYAHVFDRVSMLNGDPATRQSFGGYPNFMMPADADGSTPPPAGAPNYFYTFFAEGYPDHPAGGDRLALYTFQVDWDTPGNSTFALAQELPIADYNYTVCGFFVGDCIPQAGTSQGLDSLSYWPMWRFQYRNFGSYEAAVGNFTVDLDGTDKAAIRWFELRRGGAQTAEAEPLWELYQEGTHAPDDDHRWMGSIAMDASSNIALGYSVSSSSTHPSIRYATRLHSDPLGTLQDEATLIDGGGSQTSTHRWGDYSAMTVDPVDGCTFWYTTEYHPANDEGFSWHTRIGTFRLPECTGSVDPDFTIMVTPHSQQVCAPNEASYDIEIGSLEGFSELVNLSVVDAPAGTTTSFSVDPVMPSDPPAMSVLTIGDTDMAAAGSYSFEIVGEASSTSQSQMVDLYIFSGVPEAPMLISPHDEATGIEVSPTFEWSAVDGVTEYWLEVARDADFTDIVYSAAESGTSHMVEGALEYESKYYWHVIPKNGCGDGMASDTFTFMTMDTPITFCSTPHLEIPDNDPAGVSDTLNNPNMGELLDVDISVNTPHTWVGDLIFTVEHNGTSVTIVDQPGIPASEFGCEGDDIDAILDDEAGTSVEDECHEGVPSIQGSFIPDEMLSAFDGMEVHGDWTIMVSDNVTGDTGVLDEWCVIPVLDTPPTATPTATVPVSHTATPTATVPVSHTPTPTTTSVPPTHTPTVTTTPISGCTAGAVDLAIEKSDASDPAMVGEDLTYTIMVENLCPTSALNTTVFDALPASVAFVSASASQGECSEADGGMTCELGSLMGNGSAEITLVVEPMTPGAITNVANVASATEDYDLGNNTATEETNVIDTGIQMDSVSPHYGLNNVPTSIYIAGYGFSNPESDPLTVDLGDDALEVLYVDPNLVVALVPAGLEAGYYDIMVHAPAGSDTLANGYEVIAAEVVDDLVSSPDWLWTDPSPMRMDYTNSRIGLLVQHLGGSGTIDDVEVEFYLDSPDGELLGRGFTIPLAPFAIEPTGGVTWQPEADGEYTICAVIDPDDNVPETNEENNTTCRLITVLPGLNDTTPPIVEGFIIEDDAPTTTDIDVTLDVMASDNGPGATGVGHVKYIEFEYILGAHKWVPVERSDWLDYEMANENYPWSLVPAYGMRYMQAWVADNARNISNIGNISLLPSVDVIDLLPSEQAGFVAQNGVVFYRFYVEEGQTLTAVVEPVSGDPDLYVWGPNGQLWHSNGVTGVETVSFEAPATGTYQIEVHGYTNAEYRLNFSSTAIRGASVHAGEKEVPDNPAVPLESWPEFYDVEAPPAGEPMMHHLYLPAIVR